MNNATNIVSIILAIVVTLIMILVVAMTPILRESTGTPPAPPAKSPYSFSRFQLFLWTLVIVPLFALHWGHYGPANLINQTALILLGISAATTVSAGIVTSAQNKVVPPAPIKANNTSTSFWADILSDNNGQFSIVRLQQLIFTIVYIGIFVTDFFLKFQFPDFDANAYILMGISTGSYVIGKSLNV